MKISAEQIQNDLPFPAMEKTGSYQLGFLKFTPTVTTVISSLNSSRAAFAKDFTLFLPQSLSAQFDPLLFNNMTNSVKNLENQ